MLCGGHCGMILLPALLPSLLYMCIAIVAVIMLTYMEEIDGKLVTGGATSHFHLLLNRNTIYVSFIHTH